MIVWRRLASLVAEHGAAALVSVHAVRGSAPREAGARIIVRPDGAFHGTIGGGQLEWQMLAAARDALAAGRREARFVDQALGPDLGQCCGGRVTVLIETFGAGDAAELAALVEAESEGVFAVECQLDNGRVKRTHHPSPLAGEGGPRVSEGRERGSGANPSASAAPPPSPGSLRSPPSPSGGEGWNVWRETYGEASTPLLLFGAGHVGRAVVLALAPLPFTLRWIDSREDAFPQNIPANVTPVRARDPAAELTHAQEDAFILVMTHEHPLDLAIAAAALQRGFPYVGLIGSDTKRARFEKRFRELGLPESRIRTLACPIGLPGIASKEPAVIAASVTAQVLQERERVARGTLSQESGVRLRSAP